MPLKNKDFAHMGEPTLNNHSTHRVDGQGSHPGRVVRGDILYRRGTCECVTVTWPRTFTVWLKRADGHEFGIAWSQLWREYERTCACEA